MESSCLSLNPCCASNSMNRGIIWIMSSSCCDRIIYWDTNLYFVVIIVFPTPFKVCGHILCLWDSREVYIERQNGGKRGQSAWLMSRMHTPTLVSLKWNVLRERMDYMAQWPPSAREHEDLDGEDIRSNESLNIRGMFSIVWVPHKILYNPGEGVWGLLDWA